MRPRRQALGVSKPWTDPAIEVRKRAAAALKARIRRQEWAAILLRRGQTGLTDATERKLYDASKSHERALRHHRAATKHHDAARGSIDEMRTVHRKLTATLERLGIPDRAVQEHLDALDKHIDSARDSQETGADHVTNLGGAVDRAARCVRSVLSGLEQSAPADEVEDDEQADIEDRAARARRLAVDLGRGVDA